MKIKRNADSVVYLWTQLHSYLEEYLPLVRSASVHTVSTYKESLNSFISFLADTKGIPRNKMDFTTFNRQNVKDFLKWLTNTKCLAPKTCNLRLTAIRAFLEYSTQEDASLMHICVEVGTVKNLKTPSKPIEYLKNNELQALLAAPGTKTKTCRRDRMLLIFEYDAALRVGELVNVRICDIHFKKNESYVTIIGKGRKLRNVPLMEKTICHLHKYLEEFHEGSSWRSEAPLFYSLRDGKPHKLSTDSIEKLLKKYASQVDTESVDVPHGISCHIMRKTRAMDLYQAGIPLTYIAQILGHSNISTTSGFYAFATLETLHEALKLASPKAFQEEEKWNSPDVKQALFYL